MSDPVTAGTPGQAAQVAYDKAHGVEHPRSAWKYYSESEREAWEIAVRAGHEVIAVQQPQPAPELAADNSINSPGPRSEGLSAPELYAALGDWPAILADVTQQRDDLRELLAEIIGSFRTPYAAIGQLEIRVPKSRVAKWHKRAGLPS